MLEELLVLFKGRAFDHVINLIRQTNDKCDYIFSTASDKQTFVDKTHLIEQADLIESLLVDLEFYTKRQQWFYADFICSICNPLNQRYISISAERSTLKVHVSTCSHMLEIKDFEVRVALQFHNFINPYIRVVECLNQIDAEEGKIINDDEEYDLNEPSYIDSIGRNRQGNEDEIPGVSKNQV